MSNKSPKTAPKKSNIVYHYCSVETFRKIITNKELWLTNVTKSNDSKELQLVFEKLTSELEQRTNIHNNTREDFVPLSMFAEFLKGFKEIEQLFHVFCFSKDSDSLSQWSMYADNATGIAIGFNSTYFSNLKKINNDIDFGQIKYSLNSFSDTINQKLKQLTDMYKRCNKGDYSWYLGFMHYVIDDVLKMAYLYKDISFKQEHEYRIVYNSYPCICDEHTGNTPSFTQTFNPNEITISSDTSLGEIGHYVSRGKLVSYRPLRLKDFGSAIAEIVIGPKSMITVHDIEMLLIANGIDLSACNVKLSTSTYQ